MALLGVRKEGQIGDINSCDKKNNQSHPSLSLFANAKARKYRRFPLVALRTSQPTVEGGENICRGIFFDFFKLFTCPHRIR